MVVLAFLTDPVVVEKILKHLELPSVTPPLLPALGSSDEPDLFFDTQADCRTIEQGFIEKRASRYRPARAPP